MTTITVEIDKDRDLSAVKELIGKLGLKYSVIDSDELVYTDEFKNMLDQRYADHLEGNVELISPDESRRRITELLATKNK